MDVIQFDDMDTTQWKLHFDCVQLKMRGLHQCIELEGGNYFSLSIYNIDLHLSAPPAHFRHSNQLYDALRAIFARVIVYATTRERVRTFISFPLLDYIWRHTQVVLTAGLAKSKQLKRALQQ